MGGRGTFASGNTVAYTFESMGTMNGVKVLRGLNGKHGLPEEAHSSYSYVQVDYNGNFKEIRFYDEEHYLTLEIAYHKEPKLDPSGEPVLHYHLYDKKFNRSEAKRATKAMRKRYGSFVKGVIKT